MIRSRWYTNPVFVFIFSLLALGTSLFLYIQSYLRVNEAFYRFVKERNLDASQFLETETWVMILILSVLVAIILSGLFIIFVYYQKVIQLYRMQQNFINGFTHELKTPIASLGLFIDTFSKHELSREKQQEYLGFMKRDTRRLADNVNQILSLTKIEDKKYQGEWKVHDLKEFIREWIEESEYFEKDASIEIEGDGEFNIRFDYESMKMVFANLFNNAIIYNDSSSCRIKIRFVRQERNILVSVQDNGIGIAKNEHKNIFKKFYQVDRHGKGSGLGLYTVQQVVRLHKGQVKIYGEGIDAKRGSTFMLSFPREESGELFL